VVAGRVVVRLPRKLADEMIVHARSELPNEACGIFGGTSGGTLRTFYPARNADASPYRYSVDSMDLLRITTTIEDDDEDEVAAIYHSHTMSPPSPSRTDMELATWPEAAYLIVSLKNDPPEIRAWRLAEGSPPEELQIEIV
jgi:proteasome lid subunit RPN8/RPN11